MFGGLILYVPTLTKTVQTLLTVVCCLFSTGVTKTFATYLHFAKNQNAECLMHN